MSGYLGWIALWVLFAGLVFVLSLKLYDSGEDT